MLHYYCLSFVLDSEDKFGQAYLAHRATPVKEETRQSSDPDVLLCTLTLTFSQLKEASLFTTLSLLFLHWCVREAHLSCKFAFVLVLTKP